MAPDHAQIAASPLLQCAHTGLQIVDFGVQLLVALDELVVLQPLRRNGALQAIDFAHAAVRDPHPELQEHHDQSQGCREPFH